MNRNVFIGEETEYEEREEGQESTLLSEDDEPVQADTLLDEDDEDHFQDTVFADEDDEDEDEKRTQRTTEDFASEEPVRYRLEDYYVTEGAEKYGEGGQGEVYRCYREGTKDIYAAKIHKNGLSSKKIKVIENILHMENRCESIYKIYAAGYVGDGTDQRKTYMIVTKEYQELKKYQEWEKRQKSKEYLNYLKHGTESDYKEKLRCAVEDMNNALTAMHNARINGQNQHIYHSDIKPQNIMWDPDGRKGDGCLVLIDFDGGAVNDREERLSVANDAKTKLYTAPELEQMRDSEVNEYTDNYSLGVTLAELITGVMPVIGELDSAAKSKTEEKSRRKEEREAARVYYEKYGETGIQIWNQYLLPPELPEYVRTLLKGLLYHDYARPKERLGQKDRWNDKMLRQWIDLVTAGRYEDAAALPCGPIGQKKETAEPENYGTGTRIGTVDMPLRDSIKCRIPYNDGVATIHSVEEMAEQFVRHWTETVSLLVTDEDFPGAFRSLGDDTVYNLRRAQKNMKGNSKKKDDIFEKEVIEVYLSDAFKRENLRYYGRVYTSKEAFGKKLYAGLIASRDQAKKAYSRLPEGQAGKSREFNDILTMFSKGIVSGFLRDGNHRWQIDADTLQMISKVEQHMDGERLNARTVEQLYRIAFRLQGNASHIIEKKRYKNYADFSQQLLSMVKVNLESAAAIRNQCMTDDGRLKVDVYAWMQETEGVVVYPTEKEREQF